MPALLDSSAFFRRPPFIADGRVVARREVKLSKVYSAGDEIPRREFDERSFVILWDQGLIDTLPQQANPAKPPPQTPPQTNSKQRR